MNRSDYQQHITNMEEMIKLLNRAIEIKRDEGTHQLLSAIYKRMMSKRHRLKLLRFNSYRIYVKNNILYDAPAHPFKTIWIKPESVKYWGAPPVYSWGLGQVTGGNWDKKRNLKLADNQWTVEGLRQRFEDGEDWRETKYIENAKHQLEENDMYRGCSSVEEFVELRCSYVENLYRDIKHNGYRPQSEENSNRKGIGSSDHDLEPIVSIGRDGTIILKGGYHRFAIARILDLRIPVNVDIRHEKWQCVRDDVHNFGSNVVDENQLYHPDLQDILSHRSSMRRTSSANRSYPD